MKIVKVETIISRGTFPESEEWKAIRKSVIECVKAVDWPVGSGKFTIRPESGKKRGEGNGVKPIKDTAISLMQADGWQPNFPWPTGERIRPGNMDAAYKSGKGLVAFEWETGNISSSHRSINKMCLGLLTGKTIGGILVVPSRKLYVYLTDRIGNISELEPYFPLWRSISCKEGILEILVIEHDEESKDVIRIPKGTDGRSKN